MASIYNYYVHFFRPLLKPVILEGEVKLSFPDCEVLNNLVLQLDDVSFRYCFESEDSVTKLYELNAAKRHS